MDAKPRPRWRTWAEPLRRAAANAGRHATHHSGRNGNGHDLGRDGRDIRPHFPRIAETSPQTASLQSTLIDCCIATGGVALALLLRKALGPVLGSSQPFITFYFAVFAAAWFGGSITGLLTVILSALAGWYFFARLQMPSSIGAAISVSMFSAIGLIAIALTEAYRRAQLRADNADEAAQLYQDQIKRQSAERETVERALRAAEDRLRRTVDSSIVGTVTVDGEDVITHANDEFLRMLGYSREEFAARRPTWRELTPPEFADADNRAMEQLDRDGRCAPYEKEYLHHDGHTRVPVMISGMRFEPPETGGIGFIVDLSSQSSAKKVLALQSRVLDSMAEGVVVDDVHGNIAFTNPALDEMFGYAPGELVGKRVAELHMTTGDDWQDLLEEIRLALRHRGHWSGELDHRRKDGSSFSAMAHIRAVANSAEGGDHWVCVVEDTTLTRAKERAVHEAEDRLSMAMAAASMGAWELDPRTDQLTASANVRSLMSNGDEHEVIPMEDFYAKLHPEDSDRVRQAVHDALAGTHDYDVEFRGVRDDGQTRWLAARAKVFRDEFGHPQRMTGVTMDITDRRAAELSLRQSEERFRLAAEAVAALIYDWDWRTNFVLRSPALSKITGFAPHEVDGDERWWRERMHPDDLAAAQTRLDRAIAENEPGFALEYRVRHLDGHWVHIWDRCMIVRDCNDQVTRIIGSAVDVTELKRVHRELQQAKEIAESADRAKDQFLAVLSHELRTPLTPVLSAVQLWATDDSLPFEARQDMEMIRRNVELEARLIDDLLDLTRVARGKIDLQLHPTDAHTAIRRAVEVCQPETSIKNLELVLDLAAEHSVIVADAARLQQIISNLLQNAVKFTPEDRRITVRTTSSDGSHLVIQVIDDGIGIAPQSLTRIFDAFEQVSRDVTRRYGGLGLGLTISKKLVDLHGGELTAESEGIGHGSTFTLRFPLGTSQDVAAPSPDSKPDVTLSDAGHDSLRILLVEDHLDTAEMMARLLRANNYQVQVAGNVADALEVASRETFDLVISDLGLPDGSGHDLMQRLLDRANGRPIKGIALSGFGMDTDLDRSRESGFRDHLTKPVDLQRLEASILRVVQAE